MKRYRIIALIYIVLLFGGLLGSLTLTGHYFADFTSAEGRIGAKTEAALRQNLPLRDALKQWKTTLLMLGGVVWAGVITAAVAVTPGFESPTISPLHDKQWCAVRMRTENSPGQCNE